jgi:hypothetical protein
MFDFDYSARSETHELLWRILQPHRDRKALSHAHPVQGTLYIVDGARDIDPILIDDAPADSLNRPFDRSFSAADRSADGRLTRERVCKTAADKGNTRDASRRDSNDSAQQPGWKECTKQIERRRTVRGTSAETERRQKNEDARPHGRAYHHVRNWEGAHHENR